VACEALHVKLWTAQARASYEKALALTQQEPERQFLAMRLEELK
jgi:RNA polymerase sigma-70 factor (ECF subfamily)